MCHLTYCTDKYYLKGSIVIDKLAPQLKTYSRESTRERTHGHMDGRYQVHYLSASLSYVVN